MQRKTPPLASDINKNSNKNININICCQYKGLPNFNLSKYAITQDTRDDVCRVLDRYYTQLFIAEGLGRTDDLFRCIIEPFTEPPI
jgi:hypothetical protein